MKKIKYLLLFIFVIMLVGCSFEKDNAVKFNDYYIRTDTNTMEITSPVIKKITSMEELNNYYKENKDNYNLVDSTSESISYLTATDKYDEEYFKKSILLIIVIKENSSDIRHEVSKINDNGKIIISKNDLDNNNSDVATWHILLEVDKKYSNLDYMVSIDS